MNMNDALAASVSMVNHTPTSNTAAVCTATAPTAIGQTNYFFGCIISGSAAPAAATTVTITGLVGGTITMEIPASAFAPIVITMGTHPLPATKGVDIVLTVGQLGSGVVGSATMFYAQGAV